MKAKFIGNPKYNKSGSGYYHCSYKPEEGVLYNKIYDVVRDNNSINVECYGVKMECGNLLSFNKSYWDFNIKE